MGTGAVGTGAGAAVRDVGADEAWTNGNTVLAMRLYRDRLAADPGDGTAMLRLALMQA